ncbi:hypothetical protein K491DRAFT_710925 [Lophiostoma macrostomum CBS 122681]|uniref:Uncharacterized protein n=1 Tax=Lophiostoma macrostomum CBS 122681 TaxID=1314788 RepID=A0A6A6TPG0_9PLEO|nr:hypothetical protein K491DRAFT_710925 [Lophiostoma macrostomum CBS 122681]
MQSHIKSVYGSNDVEYASKQHAQRHEEASRHPNQSRASRKRSQERATSSNHHAGSENNLPDQPSSLHQAPPSQYEQYAWHAVPRPWSTTATHNEHAISGRDQHSYSNHNVTVPPGNAPEVYNAPLGLTLANLQQLDDVQEETDPMTLWMQEKQRTAPWDAVGYVKEAEQVRRG